MPSFTSLAGRVTETEFPQNERFKTTCTSTARALCTRPFQVTCHCKGLVDLHLCANFRIPTSKHSGIRASQNQWILKKCQKYVRARCMCTCTRPPRVIHRWIALIELHLCAKFCSSSSKDTGIRGSQSWRIQNHVRPCCTCNVHPSAPGPPLDFKSL